MYMYSPKMMSLVMAALADNKISEKERQILLKRAKEEGLDLDEFEMMLDALLLELQEEEDKEEENDEEDEKAKRQTGSKRREKTRQPARQSAKHGEVRKCPACGSLVGAFQGSCPACGYEFANVAPNRSSQKLYDALTSANSYSQKIEIIETFPIPVTKSDLLEFLTALKPRIADADADDKLQQAYFKKYSECIEKAKVSFAVDKQLQPFVDGYGDLVKRIKRGKTAERLKEVLAFVGILIFEYWYIALFVVLFAVYGISELVAGIQTKYDDMVIARKTPVVERYINEGSADEAKSVLEEMRTMDFESAYKLLQLYASRNDVENAIYVYNNLIPKSRNKDQSSARSLLVNLLIKTGDYNKAWDYYPKRDDGSQYAGNAQSYYQFMADVITYLCKEKDKAAAREFITEYALWFDKYVDNGEYGKDHMDYSYARSRAKLLQFLNKL